MLSRDFLFAAFANNCVFRDGAEGPLGGSPPAMFLLAPKLLGAFINYFIIAPPPP